MVFDLRHSRHKTCVTQRIQSVLALEAFSFPLFLLEEEEKESDEDYHSYLVDPASNICLSRRLSHASPE